jgi:archaellum component FlaC
MQESELNQFRQEFQKLKKPSAELQMQLEKAENLLKQSQTELQDVKQDLTALRKDRDELKTSLQILKEQINKERRIHRRQIWQNRFWCLLFGVGVGCAIK